MSWIGKYPPWCIAEANSSIANFALLAFSSSPAVVFFLFLGAGVVEDDEGEEVEEGEVGSEEAEDILTVSHSNATMRTTRFRTQQKRIFSLHKKCASYKNGVMFVTLLDCGSKTNAPFFCGSKSTEPWEPQISAMLFSPLFIISVVIYIEKRANTRRILPHARNL